MTWTGPDWLGSRGGAREWDSCEETTMQDERQICEESANVAAEIMHLVPEPERSRVSAQVTRGIQETSTAAYKRGMRAGGAIMREVSASVAVSTGLLSSPTGKQVA